MFVRLPGLWLLLSISVNLFGADYRHNGVDQLLAAEHEPDGTD